MSEIPSRIGPQLIDDKQAERVGFEEGTRLRKDGGLPEHLADQMETIERGAPTERGSNNRFNSGWRRGFAAGYMGNALEHR